MASSTAQRLKKSALVKIENITEDENGVEIKIPDNFETSATGRYRPLLMFVSFNKKPQLLNLYLTRKRIVT